MKKITFIVLSLAFSLFISAPRINAADTELTTANQFCVFSSTGTGATSQTSGDVLLSQTNYPEGCVIYESLNGVSSGNLTIDNTTIVLHKTLTFDPGQKIDIINGGRIWVNTGGEIEQGKLCVKDVDNDHYAETKTVATDPNTGLPLSTSVTEIDYTIADNTNICPAGYNLRESMNDLTVVDNDATTNDSSKISTSDRELLRLGFSLAGVTDALAAAGDVQVINKNMLICTAGTCPTTNFAADSGSLYVAGNVGIGTPTPQKNLEVYSPGGGSLRLSSDDVFASGIQFYSYGGSQEYSKIQLNSESNGLEIWNSIPVPVVFGTDNLERVRVSESGNVGIGTTTPNTFLHIVGTTNNQQLRISDYGIDNSTQGRLEIGYDTTGNYGRFQTWDNAIGVGAITLNPSGGNVGIGTTAPANPISVVSSTNNVSQIQFGLNTPNAGGYLSSVYDHQFNLSAGARLTTSAAWEARNANSAILGAYGGNLYFFTNTGLTVGSTFTPTERMRITSAGNVGIGITNPSYKLQVSGTLYVSGSSRDYKENIKPLEVDSSKIYQLNPVSYDYKPQYKDLGYNLAGGHQIGLIAEDVAKVYPELAITLDRDGVKNKVSNVDYEKLSILLLAEMKNQKKEIDSLQQKVDYLEQKLIDIETKLK